MKRHPKSIAARYFPQPSYKILVLLWISILVVGGSLGCLSKKQNYPAIQTCFTPNEQCTEFVQEALATAQHTILVQSYIFTSSIIADALITAHERGIKVKILVDSSQSIAKGSKLQLLIAKGIPVFIDKVPGAAHNKVMIIDDTQVLTGSYNWTDAAEHRNSENLILISNTDTNRAYRINWEKRAEQAQVMSLTDTNKPTE